MKLKQAWHTVFRSLSPNEVAAYELAEAELELLESQTGQEYANAMVGYHQTRIVRLHAFLAASEAAK